MRHSSLPRVSLPRVATSVLASLVALVLLGALSACSDLSGTHNDSYITGDGQISVWAPAKRSAPVDLHGDLLGGGTWSSTTVRGKPVVVNVWWSNCGPCRKEMPMLQAAATQLAGTATFIGVNTRDNSADNGLSFERALGVTYPSIYAPDGQALLALPGLPQAVPSTVVLDATGRIAAIVSGALPSRLTLTQLVQCIAQNDGKDECKVTGKA